jgi:vanillate O-demethylase ferredoxin subunit
MSQLKVKVVSKINEAEDIVSFELASADDAKLPLFSAGSHIDVHIGEGVIRQYSLCNPPHEDHRYQIGVLRDLNSRGGSIAMHDDIMVGDVITISEPKNHFPLVQAKRSLLFAGGIGITPILCMAERLTRADGDFAMHYCTRAPERTAFRDRISRSPFAQHVVYHHDNGADEQRLQLAELIATPEEGTHIYVCGPGGFIDHVVKTAREKGWPPEQVHLEYFSAGAVETKGDKAFDVRIASTGQVFTIPAGETVIAVLNHNGIDIPVSCEQGVCGTCLTRVLEGEPDHRDLYMTDKEHAANDQFTPCCSRSKSAVLVLDI